MVGRGTWAFSTVTHDDMVRSHSETGPALSRSNINDLVAFVAVARARSFTKARPRKVLLKMGGLLPILPRAGDIHLQPSWLYSMPCGTAQDRAGHRAGNGKDY